jgi:hypothetical protein
MENNVLIVNVGDAFCLIVRHAERFEKLLARSNSSTVQLTGNMPDMSLLGGGWLRVVGYR